MKFSKTTSVLMAAALILTPVSGTTAYAEDSAKAVETVFSEFNKNDVNGRVIVTLPENTSAEIDITANTPEGNYKYYTGTFSSAESSVYSFDMEGYDKLTEDPTGEFQYIDGRDYTVEITITDLELELTSGKYVEKINVPDGGMNPGSWTDFSYILNVEQKESDEICTVEQTERDENGVKIIEKNVTFYVSDAYVKGDVNEDGNIDAIDASAVLKEYAEVSTNHPASFTDAQKKAADVNEDKNIDAVDASKILKYYADAATGNKPSWD